jgi:hypothetical protein
MPSTAEALFGKHHGTFPGVLAPHPALLTFVLRGECLVQWHRYLPRHVIGLLVQRLDKGWPVQILDCTAEGADAIAARIVALIYRVVDEKSLVCP